MQSAPQSSPRWPVAVGVLILLCATACSKRSKPEPKPESDEGSLTHQALEIESPMPRLRIPQQVELLSESLTNAFSLFANKVFIRDWDGVEDFFHPDFRGHNPFGLPVKSTHDLALGAKIYESDVTAAPIVDRDALVQSLELRVGAWRRLEESLWKVRGAEFERAKLPTWGRVEWAAHMVGITTDVGRELVELEGIARVERVDGKYWQVSRLEIHEVVYTRGGKELFRDVTRSAGVHHQGLRYGKPGNDSDGWNGIASHDVNGDGLWDVFIPSPQRSFLYLGTKGGGFEESAEAAGLLKTQGGTAALFFDFENDGDPDLLVGHVGWHDLRNKGGGQTLSAYKNDGKGHFTEVTEAMGLDKIRCAAFGLTALDADGDGFLDVYVCAYGRMGHRRNDSWQEATNGEPDLLLMNREGLAFDDGSDEAGIAERGWSYSSVAADYDRDGDTDIYVATTFGSNHLWQNKGDGTFVNVAKDRGVALQGNSMGVSVGDPNEDGYLDFFLTNPSSNTGRRILRRFEEDERSNAWSNLARMAGGNLMLQGNKNGEFTIVEGAGGAGGAGWAWGQACVDLDLDGHQDLYCVNGFVTGDIPRDT